MKPLRMVFSRLIQISAMFLAMAFIMTAKPGFAADPQPYIVTISNSGNTELDQLLKDSSSLMALNGQAPVGPFALVARARADISRFITALHSLGYYQGKVQIRIADRPLDDPGLYDTIDYAPAQPPVPVLVSVETGALFHLGNIHIQGAVPDQAYQWLGLKPQSPARAADVLAARERLLAGLRDAGYALAKVDEPVAKLVLPNNTVDISYPVAAGQQAAIGPITVTGLDKVHGPFVRGRLQLSEGAAFNPATIEKARQELLATGAFSTVRTNAAKQLDAQGQLPITFVVNERLRHTTNLGGAYSTDLGGSFTTLWQHHNLLGNAEQLNLNAGMTQLGGNSTNGIGYNLAATFIKPDFLRIGQALKVGLNALRQNLDAYQQDSFIGEMALSRKLADFWRGGIGLALEQAHISQENSNRDYTLLSLPLSMKYDSTDNLLNPSAGELLTIAVTPVQSLADAEVGAFAVMQVSGSTYLDLSGQGRSVLALRGLLGDIEGAGRFALPPDKRFYAGGSNTVRGYQYQSIAPQFASGNPEGGTAIAAGTVELRQRILADYGIVVFADAGQVSPNDLLFSGAWRIGAGIGARYYTAFGPLRLDAAVPVNSQSNSGSFELYIGLGQAF